MHAFVDESYRNRYLIACTLVAPRALNPTRSMLRSMLLPGQRRLHFHDENLQRRRELLGRMCSLELVVRVYEMRARERTARPALLAAVLADLKELSVGRLVIESRESRDHLDRQVIAGMQRQGKASLDLVYEHLRPYEEPVLWVSDAVAWAVGAGGDWRSRVNRIVGKVGEHGP